MRKKLSGIVALMLAICGNAYLFAQQASPAAPSNLLLILDGSGSMWGQIEGKNKIVIARQVLIDVLAGLPVETRAGLVAYGHRSEGDCEDIEMVAPLGRQNREALSQKIDALMPKGKTPITGAIREAFASLTAQEQPATLILVSDGLETCGGDPCAVVAEAKKAGLKFVMHVVGFDVGEVDVAQLECTAQAGGGLYFSAQNAGELAMALQQTVAAPAELASGTLAVKSIADGKLEDVLIKVVREQDGQEMARGRTYSAAATNPRFIALPAGRYRVEVEAIRMKGSVQQTLSGVTIAEGDTVLQLVDFSTGELAIKVTRNGALSDATIRVYRAGTTEQVAAGRTYRGEKSNPRVYRITPGTYDVEIGSVEISDNPKIRIEKVVVEGGKRVMRSHDFVTGTLKVGAVQAGALVDAIVKVWEARSGRQVGQGRTYTSENTNPRTFEIAPGEYKVEVSAIKLPGAPKKILNLTVSAGSVSTGTVEFE